MFQVFIVLYRVTDFETVRQRFHHDIEYDQINAAFMNDLHGRIDILGIMDFQGTVFLEDLAAEIAGKSVVINDQNPGNGHVLSQDVTYQN